VTQHLVFATITADRWDNDKVQIPSGEFVALSGGEYVIAVDARIEPLGMHPADKRIPSGMLFYVHALMKEPIWLD
jgi:hypothetical protein